MTAITVFGYKKFNAQIQFFLAFLECQTHNGKQKFQLQWDNSYSKAHAQRMLYLQTKLIIEKKHICLD